jgi:hypothetical protein
MSGRIKRKKALADPRLAVSAADEEGVCPLCHRPIPVAQRDAHHLLPRSRGGVETVWLHRICHRQIHALLTEAELERDYQQVDALRLHPGMARFLEWVRSKPDGFFERTRKSQRLRKR